MNKQIPVVKNNIPVGHNYISKISSATETTVKKTSAGNTSIVHHKPCGPLQGMHSLESAHAPACEA